jgi:formate-dependent nitrite reductase cytochrome c552 subunit
MKPTPVVCTVCGGANVEYMTWVSPNDNTIVGDPNRTWAERARAGESWCSDCHEHTELTDTNQLPERLSLRCGRALNQ